MADTAHPHTHTAADPKPSAAEAKEAAKEARADAKEAKKKADAAADLLDAVAEIAAKAAKAKDGWDAKDGDVTLRAVALDKAKEACRAAGKL